MFFTKETTKKLVAASSKYCSVKLEIFKPHPAIMIRDRRDRKLKKGAKIELHLTPAGDIQVLNSRGEICETVEGTLPGAPGQKSIYATFVEGIDFKAL